MISSIGNSAVSLPSLQQLQGTSTEAEIFMRNSASSREKNGAVLKNSLKNYVKGSNNDISENDEDDKTDYLNKTDSDDNIKVKKSDSPIQLLGQKKETPDIFPKPDNSDEETVYGNTTYSIMSSFGALAAAVGASSRGVTKSDLITFLQRVASDKSSGADAEVIAFLKNLIAQFEELSGGDDYLTSFVGIKEPQDYSTVTKEQVTLPIDIRI